MRTKTAAAAALAALAIPVSAQATGPDHEHKSHDRGKSSEHRKGEHAKGHHHGRKAFIVKGSTAQTALPVAGGELTGPLTVDPRSANRPARTFLQVTKEQVDGTQTVSFGEAGDDVKVVYKGLESTDPIQPTDVLKAYGKVRDGELDVRVIKVKRRS